MQSRLVRAPAKLRVPIDGVLLLDKPAGISSNDALIKAKRLFNAKKAGHTGTLDPFATGLLPLCFGEATKFAQDLLDAEKSYQTTLQLGVCTTTGDTEGDILARCDLQLSKPITEAQIKAVLARFRGPIAQIPPMYSALKRDGKPFYEYARAGITLEREPRPVTIHALELIAYNSPYLTLAVRCSKGTYIRVLGEDIGAALGCGAHLQALRRTAVGDLRLENALTLEQIDAVAEPQRAAMLAPTDALLQNYLALQLDAESSRRFMHGQRLNMNQTNESSTKITRVRVYRANDQQLLGTANLNQFGILAPERLIAGLSQSTCVETSVSP